MAKPPSSKARSSKTAVRRDDRPQEAESLIEKFVKYRKANGLTQDAAALRMDMSVNSLKAYERRSRTPNGPATLKILTLMGALS